LTLHSESGFSNSVVVNGDRNTINQDPSGLGVNAISVTGFGETINASDVAITVGANSSATITGDFDNIVANGSGSSINLTGSNDTLIGGPGGNTLGASGENNTVIGGAGDDILLMNGGSGTFSGGGGNDVYAFGRGSGQDQIVNGVVDNADATGELDFGAGIDANQIWFQQDGNDLLISILGSNDRVTVNGWYGANGAQLQEIKLAGGLEIDAGLSQLVQAMASYGATHSDFDPATATQAPNDPGLQNAIAAAWHH
jgi:Ca2+-binding RTX toxin-like protein